MVTIRNLRAEDLAAARKICLATGGEPTKEKIQKTLCLSYCDYYVAHCCETSFVVVDENDVPYGYVLCAPDYETYAAQFAEEFLPQLKKVNGLAAFIKKNDLKMQRKYAKTYPAHLHIDILNVGQRRGVGTQLMNTLMLKLADMGVTGVYLICGTNNEKGNRFYQKYGFSTVKKAIYGNVYAIAPAEQAAKLRE